MPARMTPETTVHAPCRAAKSDPSVGPCPTPAELQPLVDIMKRLLGDGGCPWDKKQTHQSLRKYLMEEACEAIDAIDRDNPKQLCEELGDVLLQVVFHAELAERAHNFTIHDVIAGICEKLVRRHPHVFGNVRADTPEQVLYNWDQIKAQEKADAASEPELKDNAPRLLDGVARSLPSLARAQQLSDRAARVGFDWPSAARCREKVSEELAELDQAVACLDACTTSDTSGEQAQAVAEELGDLLFAIVNLGRHLHVDAELALRRCCQKFEQRFGHVERLAKQRFGRFDASCHIDLETLEGFWQQAKRIEAANSNASCSNGSNGSKTFACSDDSTDQGHA